jgi:8-oxo-dGTP pyrophosphatase MutT (NUDIX family)
MGIIAVEASCLISPVSQLTSLVVKLRYRLQLLLPGIEAQLKMAHIERRLNKNLYKIPDTARIGAVLILLYEKDNEIKTVLIQRTEYKGVHSKQISFPGGKQEPGETIQQAALREAEEEVGVNKKDITIIGELTELYIPPSNFLVFPFIGCIDYLPSFLIQPEEVEEIIEVSLTELNNPEVIHEKSLTLSSGTVVTTPYYEIQGRTVWGATAMILSEFLQIFNELEFV